MFELDPKLASAEIIISWIPDADFFPAGVTFTTATVTIRTSPYSKVRDDNPNAMLSGGPQVAGDGLSVKQLVIGGVPGAKYILEYLANFSDGIQRDGEQATIEVQ